MCAYEGRAVGTVIAVKREIVTTLILVCWLITCFIESFLRKSLHFFNKKRKKSEILTLNI